MAIGRAIQSGASVYVFDDKGYPLYCLPAGDVTKGDGLKDYTSNTVNVKRSHLILTYNEKGKVVHSALSKH